jgi:hypothetical protein
MWTLPQVGRGVHVAFDAWGPHLSECPSPCGLPAAGVAAWVGTRDLGVWAPAASSAPPHLQTVHKVAVENLICFFQKRI